MNQQSMYNSFNQNNPYVQQQSSSPAKTTDLYGNARAAFIQKVYTILSVQIFITVMFVVLSINSAAFFQFQLQNQYIVYVSLIICVFVQIFMFCCNGGRSFPTNYICIGLFTVCEAYIVSFVSSITGKQSGNSVVLLAGIYTLAIVVVLTAYACTTKSDFTTSFGIILVLSACLFILLIVSFFVNSPFLTNLYCCIGVLLFGVYLVIDTQLIVGGQNRQVQLAIDEYALAAMMLYIDIIQIFLYILRLLGNKD